MILIIWIMTEKNVFPFGSCTGAWILTLFAFPSFIFIRLCWLPQCSVTDVATHLHAYDLWPLEEHCSSAGRKKRPQGRNAGLQKVREGKATCLLSKGRHVRWTQRVVEGDNQPRQARQQELEGVLPPPGRCNFVAVSERTAGRWHQTRRRRRTGGEDLFLIFLSSCWARKGVRMLGFCNVSINLRGQMRVWGSIFGWFVSVLTHRSNLLHCRNGSDTSEPQEL